MTTRTIKIAALRVDEATQPRAEMNIATIAEYAEAMDAGAQFPPVVVFEDSSGLYLADGFHRVGASRRSGRDEIEADVRPGGQRAAQWFGYGANTSHGLRRTNTDKRRSVEGALRHPSGAALSDNQIAAHCGVSQPFVSRVRGELAASYNDYKMPERTVTRGGVTYQQNTANIGRRVEPEPEEPEPEWWTAPAALPAESGAPRQADAFVDDPGPDDDDAPPERGTHPVATAPARAPSAPRVTVSLDEWNAMDADARRGALSASSAVGSFNRQDNDSIEWARWSWNPVTGCLHGCAYCYAQSIATRFAGGDNPSYPHGFAPTLWPERLAIPSAARVPADAATNIGWRNVFTCSMADLFGAWVPDEWIAAVFAAVEQAPGFNFLFLTKNPARYAGMRFPRNAWIGTTVERQSRVRAAEEAFANVNATVKFLSCEPLSEPLTFTRLDLFDWVIIGGLSDEDRPRPDRQWIADIERAARAGGCRIYEKPNLRIREYPGAQQGRA